MDVLQMAIITEEAKDEFVDICGYNPTREFKKDLDEYLQNRKEDRNYFKYKYLDEVSGKELYLFFYKGIKFANMQNFDLKGICETDCWSEELEETGKVRDWLNFDYSYREKLDWVAVQRQLAIDKLISDLEDPYCEDYYRTKGIYARVSQIFELIGKYMSSNDNDWEEFAEAMRKLTREDGFGKFGYQPAHARTKRTDTSDL